VGVRRVDAHVGIDLAIARQKKLPVALCTWEADALVPRRIAVRTAPQPPLGRGNLAMLEPEQVDSYAREVERYLEELESHFEVRIRTVAIDAPREPRSDGTRRRAAEVAMDERGISCFTTPSESEFERIRELGREHHRQGGHVATLPHANQIWMLAGFALFRVLQPRWECIEVYPHATVRVLGQGDTSKRVREGRIRQLRAAAAYTKWPAFEGDESLRGFIHGAAHDRLDAYLAAWVAALPEPRRQPWGTAPRDVIWVPRIPS